MKLRFGTKVEWLPMAQSRGKEGFFRIYGLTCGRYLIGLLLDSPVKVQRQPNEFEELVAKVLEFNELPRNHRDIVDLEELDHHVRTVVELAEKISENGLTG